MRQYPYRSVLILLLLLGACGRDDQYVGDDFNLHGGGAGAGRSDALAEGGLGGSTSSSGGQANVSGGTPAGGPGTGDGDTGRPQDGEATGNLGGASGNLGGASGNAGAGSHAGAVGPTGGGPPAGGSTGSGGFLCAQSDGGPLFDGACTAGGATGGASGPADAEPAGSDVDADSCDSKLTRYYAAVSAAKQCDPAAAVPCTEYQGIHCPPAGVNSDSVAELSAKLSEYQAAGCTLPISSCPVAIMTPSPYTCQARAGGAPSCYSVCEHLASGRAVCVSESASCPNGSLSNGFCSGASKCCMP